MRAILVAMECEAAAVKPALKPGDKLYLTGIGKVNAAAGAAMAISEGATELINIGLAGGFGAQVEVGRVYEVCEAVEYDFDLAAINGTRVGQHDESDTPFYKLASIGRLPARVLVTGDRFTDDPKEEKWLQQEFGAELRDMEGAAIVHVCARRGVACKAIKAVTDVAGAGPMTGQYIDNRARVLAILTETLKLVL